LLAGRGRLHFVVVCVRTAEGCGLLAGRGRLHYVADILTGRLVADCSQAGVGYTTKLVQSVACRVADCSQAGVGYTRGNGTFGPLRVADCSQAGVGYTSRLEGIASTTVADCSQAGVGYTWGTGCCRLSQLRIARRPGSVTLLQR